MMTATKDACLSLRLVIPSAQRRYTEIFHFYHPIPPAPTPTPPTSHPPKKNNPETMNIDKCQKLVCNIYAKKKQCHSHESPKGGIGLRTSARRKRIWQLNSIKKHKGKKKTFNSNRYSNLLHSKLQQCPPLMKFLHFIKLLRTFKDVEIVKS